MTLYNVKLSRGRHVLQLVYFTRIFKAVAIPEIIENCYFNQTTLNGVPVIKLNNNLYLLKL